MSLDVSSFGDLADVLEALGLVNPDGSLDGDWLSSPGERLKTVLANENQRAALLRLLEEKLEGEKETDAEGREWLPIVAEDGGAVTFFFVIDQAPVDHLRIGLGVRIRTADPATATSFLLPLFIAGKDSHSFASDPILFGKPGGAIVLTSEITLSAAPLPPGTAGLRAIGLSFRVPTAADDGDPSVSLLLRGLQLPGGSGPTDVSLSVSDIDELDDGAIDLLLGLVQAQANSNAGSQIDALARLLGLGGSIAALPLEMLFSEGPGVLAEWFSQIVTTPAAKAAWLDALAELLGGAGVATVAGDTLSITLGSASFDLEINSRDGSAGRPLITPKVSFGLTNGNARMECVADLFRLDLGTGAAVAVPSVRAQLRIGTPGSPLLSGDPAVRALRAGVELSETRKPRALLALDQVQIGSNQYDVLDLSTPNAIADRAGTLISDAIADLVSQLGSAGAAISVVLGISAPADAPGLPTIDLVAFMANPLGALRRHWLDLFANHKADVPHVLAALRPLIADAGIAGSAVNGAGIEDDPWRIALVGPVALFVWADDAGRVRIGFSLSVSQSDLGERCTVIETTVSACLLDANLNTGEAAFASGIDIGVAARGRGMRRTSFGIDPVMFEAERIAARIIWRANGGVSLSVSAPNPALMIDTVVIPLEIPPLDGGFDGLTDAQWDALELLLGLFLEASRTSWLADAVHALGWRREALIGGAPPRIRLALAKLAKDPSAAITGWLGEVLLSGGSELNALLQPLARILNGSPSNFGTITGKGSPRDPYAVRVTPAAQGPCITAWIEPSGPPTDFAAQVSEAFRRWRPGAEGLDPFALAHALASEPLIAEGAGSVLNTVDALGQGLQALRERWVGSDGRLPAPDALPAGLIRHVFDDVAEAGLRPLVDLTELFGALPAATIHVAVARESEPWPFPEAPEAARIDLRPGNRTPETFAIPEVAAGIWYVALAPRLDAKLADSDPDGALGQAARLERVFAAFASVAGNVCVIADAGSAHAAWIAAEAAGPVGVNQIVTLGMALSPVALSVLDIDPGASALRLLKGLLPPEDPAEPDDPDLANARAMIAALTELPALADPAADLSPPPALPATAGAGLEIHAIYGRFRARTIERAMTAAAAGLSARMLGEYESGLRGKVTGAGIGFCLPVEAGDGGITVNGHAMIELIGAEAPLPDGGEGITIRTANALHIRAEIRRSDGWLLGGPGSGPHPEHELNWIEIDLVIPLAQGGPESASVILHDARIFGIFRPRWILRAAAEGAAEGVVTTTLPEIQVLLSGLIAELKADASAQIAALRGAMRAIGILDESEALVAEALDRLLFEPAAQIREALQDTPRLNALADAATGFFGDMDGIGIDVMGRSLSISLAGSSDDLFIGEWEMTVSASATAGVAGEFSLGRAETGRLVFSMGPIAASFEARPPDAPPLTIQLWPDPSAETFLDHAPELLIATAVKFGMDAARKLDATARPVIDGVLDALGLLGPAGPDGERPVLAPVSFLRDPVVWLRRQSVLGAPSGGFDAGRVMPLIEAFKPILGVAGGAGEWRFAPGFSMRASGAGNAIDLSIALDSSLFPTAPQELVFGGSIGLHLAGSTPPRPVADLFVGLPGAAPGRKAAHLVIGDGVSLFLRPAAGADIRLFPDPTGLGALAATAVTQALPLILNEIVAQGGDAGAITAAIGDALALREGAPPLFTSARLEAWAADPEGEFESRWASMAASALNSIASAIGQVLPASVTISASATGLVLAVGPLTFSLDTGPFCFGLAYDDSGLGLIGDITAQTRFDGSGLKELSAVIGPATIPAGGVEIHPVFSIEVGSDVATPAMELGLALAADGKQTLALQFLFDPVAMSAIIDDEGTISSDAGDVALALLTLSLDLLVDFVLQTQAMKDFLDTDVPGSGSKKIEDILEGVVLRDGDTSKVDTTLFRLVPPPDLDAVLARMLRLVENFADAGPTVNIDGILVVGLAKTGNSVGVSLELSGRLDLTSSDVVISLENDSRWIQGARKAGVTIGVLDLSGTPEFAPSLACNGVGVRISRQNGALVDTALSLGSVALHFFGEVGAGPLSGGVQIQLSDLAVAVGGGTGGNPIAGGIMGETATSGQELAPAFSPALAVQKHGNGPVLVSLSAGEGDGPWWLSIRKGFGPLYIEQVGLGVTVEQDQLKKISVFFDGNISIVGLTAAVDDLQLTFSVTSGTSFFDPANWDIDLAGLAVSADLSGVTLSGGLRKFVDPGNGENVEYVGMMMARFATYGLSIYGGYASVKVENNGEFTAFFAYGAIVGPFGGPPAFFLTGIGGGFGINRDIVVPTDLSAFDDFVMIKALDPAATPASDPMAEMADVRATFPAKDGQFWFAAGISFTSFAVVDGIAVVAVEFGDGFDLNIFGLARMALPRPQFPLVSIELGLVARFSTSEGVIWIQAQLTDNSWLLHESVRLTGGFAFVSWFDGPNKGEFVLTLGGYHPSFSRDGYPQVPRLGFHWEPISNIVIKGENYFALTSEAVMAGGSLEASAHFGPAWAEVSFGANVIIYFDPFRYEADAHARIAAGVTIDVWIGEITISVSLSATIRVEGPEFHGIVTFDVGPIELEVEFGDSKQSSAAYISWSEFVPKYLEEVAPGRARVLTAITGKGSLPPGTDEGAGGESGTADGSVAHPYEVLSEFELSVTTIMPANAVKIGIHATIHHDTSMALGLPPLNASLSSSILTLSLKEVGGDVELINGTGITTTIRETGNFPAAVWGPPQDMSNKKVPKGEVISAVEGAHVKFAPRLVNRINKEIAFNQVEAGPRQPLPFVQSATVRPELLTQAQNLAALLPDDPGMKEVFEFSAEWMAAAGQGATATAALARQRTAPPRLATLGERLDLPEAEAEKNALQPVEPPGFDLEIRPPRATALFGAPTRAEMPLRRTTVSDAKRIRRVSPPSLAGIEKRFDPALAMRLELVRPVADDGKTVIAHGAIPVTRQARGAAAHVAGLGADRATRARLGALDAMTTGRGAGKATPDAGPPRKKAIEPAGISGALLPGEIALYEMPNARRAPVGMSSGRINIGGGHAALVAFGFGGAPLLSLSRAPRRIDLPPQVARFAVIAMGDGASDDGLAGWVGARELAFVGWSTALFPGGSVFVEGGNPRRHAERRGAGWIRAAEFVRRGVVTTRFDEFAPLVAVLFNSAVSEKYIREFALSLEGARENGAEPPLVVDLGSQSAVIFSLLQSHGARQASDDHSRGFSLRFSSGSDRRIAGVMASGGTADAFALALQDQDPETLLVSPLQGGGRPVEVKWRPAPKGAGRKRKSKKEEEPELEEVR